MTDDAKGKTLETGPGTPGPVDAQQSTADSSAAPPASAPAPTASSPAAAPALATPPAAAAEPAPVSPPSPAEPATPPPPVAPAAMPAAAPAATPTAAAGAPAPVPAPAAPAGPLALVLLDIGMPEAPRDAGRFLTQLYSDPHVLQTAVAGPFLDLLAWTTSLVRRSALSSALQAVGGQAPEKAQLEKLAAALALGLGGSLSRTVQPFVAFRHARPSVEDALRQAQSAGCRRVVGLFARTFASSAGSGSMRAALSLAAEDLPDLDVSMIDGFEDDAAVRAAFAAEAKEALANVPESERAGAHLLFLLQGQPVKERRDPTLPRAQQFAQAVKDAMGVANPSTFAYQTGVDPRAPLLPDAAEEIARLAGEKCRALVLVPVSHACEGLATRWELDQALSKLARELGIAHVSRANAPSGSPAFRAALEAVVTRHLDEMGRYRAA